LRAEEGSDNARIDKRRRRAEVGERRYRPAMCLMVYIAAAAPLELVAWDETAPAFHVTARLNREEAVRRQFTPAHVHYAGSHEGCGCGFQLGQYPACSVEDAEQKRASLTAFAAYLEHEVERVGRVQLWACWDGDQAEPPVGRRHLKPSALRSDDFYFVGRELVELGLDEQPPRI
jgi:hypothetical protein